MTQRKDIEHAYQNLLVNHSDPLHQGVAQYVRGNKADGGVDVCRLRLGGQIHQDPATMVDV